MDTDPRHLPRFDALRGLAVLMVLSYHSLYAVYGVDRLDFAGAFRTPAGRSPGFLLLYPLQFGWTGVSLFFVLSGFVIRRSTYRSTADFFRRRFWRLYPSYLLALTTSAVLWYFHPMWPLEHLGRHIYLHQMLVHNVFDRTYFSINPSLWSLAVEAQFYLLYPLLMLMLRRLGWPTTLVALALLSTAFRAGVFVTHGWVEDPYYWWNTPQLWFDWTLGAYAADRFAEGRFVVARPLLFGSFFAALTIASSLWRYSAPFTFTLSSLFWLVVIERAARRTTPTLRPLTLLGLCSYSFYLWHQPLLGPLRSLFGHRQTPVVVAALTLIALATIGPLSWLLYRFVEQPTHRLGRRPRASAN